MNLADVLFLVSGPAAVMFAVIEVGVILALIVGLIYWAAKSSQRARQSNETWAQEMGFQFEPSAWPLGNTQGEQLALVRTARSSQGYRFENVFRGRYRMREVILFDVDYVQGQDQDGDDIHSCVTAAAFPFPGRGVPQFEIHPQNMLHKLKSKVANSDIAIEGPGDFSRRYFVRGADAEAVRRFLPASFLSFLNGLEKPHDTIEGGNDWILIHAGKVTAKTRREWLDRMMKMIEALGSANAAHG